MQTSLSLSNPRLSWRSASVPPTSATPPSYQIEALQYPERQWRPLASDIRDTSYQLRGLKPSSDYSFRVRAQTPSGLAEPTAPVTLTSMPGDMNRDEFIRPQHFTNRSRANCRSYMEYEKKQITRRTTRNAIIACLVTQFLK